jgi:hypothetical protein
MHKRVDVGAFAPAVAQPHVRVPAALAAAVMLQLDVVLLLPLAAHSTRPKSGP